MQPVQLLVCATCRAPVSVWDLPDGSTQFMHPAHIDDSHAVLPITVDSYDALSFCDCCSAPGPRWRFQASSFVLAHGQDIKQASFGDWAFCERCAKFVRERNWPQVVEIALATLQQATDLDKSAVAALRAELTKLFKALSQNLTGIEEPKW